MELIFVIICSLLGWVVFYLKLRSERKGLIISYLRWHIKQGFESHTDEDVDDFLKGSLDIPKLPSDLKPYEYVLLCQHGKEWRIFTKADSIIHLIKKLTSLMYEARDAKSESKGCHIIPFEKAHKCKCTDCDSCELYY